MRINYILIYTLIENTFKIAIIFHNFTAYLIKYMQPWWAEKTSFKMLTSKFGVKTESKQWTCHYFVSVVREQFRFNRLCVCTWFNGSHHGSGGLQHGFINGSLVCGELAVDRERAGDVRGVAVILSAHVKQTARNTIRQEKKSLTGNVLFKTAWVQI